MKDLENSILSLIVARLDGDKIHEKNYSEYIKNLIQKGIGGFIIFGGAFGELKVFLSSLQRLAKKPLIIASDIERGVGQQVRDGLLIPSQMGIAAGFDLTREREKLKSLYSFISKEALNLGINLALTPVLDVNREIHNPIICTRSYSDNPNLVAKHGSFLISVFESNGLATCGKHFPGHGSTKIDSHIDLPTVDDDINIHLFPFKRAIRKNVSAIMVGHLLVPAIDTKPATVSDKIINQLLRENLGFKGLIITDAMNMRALSNYEYAHSLALRAGADIILHPEDPEIAVREILFAINKGIIDETVIKRALKRVNKFREMLKFRVFSQELKRDNFLSEREIFKKTVTVLKKTFDNLQSRKVIPVLSGAYNENIKKLFLENFGYAFDLKDNIFSGGVALICLFTNIRAAGKEYEIGDWEISRINSMISMRDSVIVSFGNPYIIRNIALNKAKAVVLMYDSNELAVNAFIDSLNEGFKESGTLPIELNLRLDAYSE